MAPEENDKEIDLVGAQATKCHHAVKLGAYEE